MTQELRKSFIQNKQVWDGDDSLAQQKIILHALIEARLAYKKEPTVEKKSSTWGKKLKRFILGPKHAGGI